MAAQTTAVDVDAQLKELWALRESFFADDPSLKETYVVERGAEIATAVAAHLRARARVRGQGNGCPYFASDAPYFPSDAKKAAERLCSASIASAV